MRIKIFYTFLIIVLCISFTIPFYRTYIDVENTINMLNIEKQEIKETTIGLNLILHEIEKQKDKYIDIEIGTLINTWDKIHENDINIFGLDIDGNQIISVGGIDYTFSNNRLKNISINHKYNLNSYERRDSVDLGYFKIQKSPYTNLSSGGPKMLIVIFLFLIMIGGIFFLIKFEFGVHNQSHIITAIYIFLTNIVLIALTYYFMIVSSIKQLADDFLAAGYLSSSIYLSGVQVSLYSYTLLFQLLIVDIVLLIISQFRKRKVIA